MIVPNWLDLRASSHPHHPALVAGGQTVTYRELRVRAASAAGALAESGVVRGAHVAVFLPSGLDFAVVLHALVRCGAVLVPLGLRLTAAEIASQLQDAGVELLLTDSATRSPLPELRRHGWSGRVREIGSLASLADRSEAAPPIDLADRHCVVFTSGSTGRAKGVSLHYANHLWSAVGSALVLGVRRDDRWLGCLPLSHVGGLSILLRSVIYGTTALLHDGFDPEHVSRAIDEDGVTIVSVVANMLQRVMDVRAGHPFPSTLRCVLLGGGPAPRSLLERSAAERVPLFHTYGLTEAASQVATGPPQLGFDDVGRPLPCSEVAIAPDGEILVRSPTIASGYVDGRTPLTDTAGWLHTGDLGSIDESGRLHVGGRRDDTIVTGGENVHPLEVELALQSHPEVVETCVFGVPDERWGRAVHARVRLRREGTVGVADLTDHLRTRLAAYKVPRVIELVDDFPRTPSGKILRPRY